jgi:hypothetical protein
MMDAIKIKKGRFDVPPFLSAVSTIAMKSGEIAP